MPIELGGGDQREMDYPQQCKHAVHRMKSNDKCGGDRKRSELLNDVNQCGHVCNNTEQDNGNADLTNNLASNEENKASVPHKSTKKRIQKEGDVLADSRSVNIDEGVAIDERKTYSNNCQEYGQLENLVLHQIVLSQSGKMVVWIDRFLDQRTELTKRSRNSLATNKLIDL